MEGAQIANCPCLTEKHEKKFYGTHPIFIYDPNDKTNRPVAGIHVNVIQLWPQFPFYVRDIFINQFSREALLDSSYRITEKQWLEKVLLRLRHELITCPVCGNEIFADVEKSVFVCPDCHHDVQRPPIIQTGNNRVVACKDKKLYQYMTNKSKPLLRTVTGVIVESKKNPGLLGLRNLTEDVWILTTKSGNTRQIAPRTSAPLLVGNSISFANGTEAIIL